MLSRENFELKHIIELQGKSRRDPNLIERALFAFGLLEALRRVDLPFIFKGGTSLLLLLDRPMRLSTDIDIIVEPGTEVDNYLEKAARIFPFRSYEEQERKEKNNIVKRHFRFQFDSPRMGEPLEIILDILFEHSKYAKVIEKPIASELLITEPEYLTVSIPDPNSILADKLTAFAPHTTGVLLGTKKDLEIMKQMFDVYMLINAMTDFDIVCKTYSDVVRDEIAYRGIEVTEQDVLLDTYEAAACVAGRGLLNPEEYKSYLKGIRSLSGHVYSLNYSAETASTYAPVIMYLAACMLKKQRFEKITNPEEFFDRQHMDKKMAKSLKSLKKRDPMAYTYSVLADNILHA
ncbi:MAG: nucleotidyl transferase AbiEii/AbiGii toxin family protein [Clostridiales bacterium]|nr:nucleotidyl transferase AbiEii/AbiGii toxin family protein [Clostridiales bacterium]